MNVAGGDYIPVVAGVIARRGRLLLCQRHDEEHLPLMWEFPGGKIDPGETPVAALERELLEELGTRATVEEQIAEVFHTYPSKKVWLRFFRVRLQGEPRPLVHRRLRWVPSRELADFRVPPPNAVVIERLRSGELHIH